MKKIALWLMFSLPSLVFACSMEQQTEWRSQAEQARLNEQFTVGIAQYRQLIACDPLRGDYRVELMRLLLDQGDIEQALEQREWLISNNAPAGLLLLSDTWIARAKQAQLANTANTYSTFQHRTRLSMGTAYSSNANEVTHERLIPVEIDGIPLQLELNQRPQHSAIHSTQLDYQRRSQYRDFYTGGLFQNYSRLDEQEWRLMMGAIQRFDCINGHICELNLHLNHQHRASIQQHQIQFGTALRTQQHAFGVYHRFLDSSNEPFAHITGLDWRLLIHQLQLHGAVEYEHSQHDRVGGDRLRAFLSASISPSNLRGLVVQVSHQREYDQQAYAPIFWGDTKRNRQTTRARAEYTHAISSDWFIQTDLAWQNTESQLVLFTHRGWMAGLRLNRLF